MHRVRLFLQLLAVVVPAHTIEALLFRTGQQSLAILVSVSAASVLLVAFALVTRGTLCLAATTLVGVLGVAEFHLVFTTFVFGVYTPGVITAVPFFVFGLIVIHAAASEYRRSRIRWADVEPAYQTW